LGQLWLARADRSNMTAASRRRFLKRKATEGAPRPTVVTRAMVAKANLAPAEPPPVPRPKATFIGRAPVFDRRMDVLGYQLIVDTIGEDPGDQPRFLLTRVLLEIGLDSLIGGRTGFINLPMQSLRDGIHHALPPERMMIEVSGEIRRADEEILRSARDDGYRMLVANIDQAERPDHVVQIVDGASIPFDEEHCEDLITQIVDWSPRAKVLVTGLREPSDVEPTKRAGATWMQGDILRPAERIDEPTIPANRVAVLQLLGELERPDVTIDDIDRLVSIDVGLSYKMLRMANSSYLALERRVERTRDAIVYLGLDTVRSVAALLSLSEATDHSPEVVKISLLRACHAKELFELTNPALANAAFTTGLFSSLDLLLGLSVDQVLDRIPVSDAIAAALRSGSGRLGEGLALVKAYEMNDLDALARSHFDPSVIVWAYRNAVAWMGRIERGLSG